MDACYGHFLYSIIDVILLLTLELRSWRWAGRINPLPRRRSVYRQREWSAYAHQYIPAAPKHGAVSGGGDHLAQALDADIAGGKSLLLIGCTHPA